MSKRCTWPDGCGTVLRQGNTTGVCGVHQKQIDEVRMSRRERSSRRNEFEEVKSAKQTLAKPTSVKQVLRAVDFFYGARAEGDGGQISFAKEVAIYLLKSDFSMCFEFVSRGLELDYNKVVRSYEKIRSLVEASPDFRQGLERVRNQYKHEVPA